MTSSNYFLELCNIIILESWLLRYLLITEYLRETGIGKCILQWVFNWMSVFWLSWFTSAKFKTALGTVNIPDSILWFIALNFCKYFPSKRSLFWLISFFNYHWFTLKFCCMYLVNTHFIFAILSCVPRQFSSAPRIEPPVTTSPSTG